MDKRFTITLIVLFSFLSLLAFTHPMYTSLTTDPLCSDFIIEEECVDNCIWEEGLCVDYIPPSCSDYLDEVSCPTTCEWDQELCQEITQEPFTSTDPEIQEILAVLPTGITDNLQLLTIINKVSGVPIPPIADVTPELLSLSTVQGESLIEEVLFLQERMQARADIKSFTMLDFDNIPTHATFIKKTISAPSQDGYTAEIIPMASEQELISSPQFQVINQEPLILAIPISNAMSLYSYIILKNVFDSASMIQTAVIPYNIKPAAPIVQAICGDDVCHEHLEDDIICPEDCARKIPWLFIIIIIVALTLIILFIHFFKDKIKTLNIKEIFKRGIKEEKVFTSETDRENLKNYVQESLKEGISREQIKSLLLAKGWTKEQVESILAELIKPKEEKPEEETKEPLEI